MCNSLNYNQLPVRIHDCKERTHRWHPAFVVMFSNPAKQSSYKRVSREEGRPDDGDNRTQLNRPSLSALPCAEHQCFDELTRNQVTPPPEGKKTLRCGKPKNIKHDYRPQQQELEKAGAVVTEYLAFILSKDSGVCQKGKYVRQLHAVQKRTTPQLFALAIQRALTYKVTSIHHLHNTFSQILKQPSTQLFASETISGYENRPEYMAGRFTQENELELPLD